MEIITYVLLGVIILCILLIWYASTYNRFQTLKIKINEVETNIDNVLRKRFDLLNKSVQLIKDNTDLESVLDSIVKLKSKKLNNFELDRQLIESLNEYHCIMEKYTDLKKKEAFMKINISLNESEAEIASFRKYYNDIITEYNKLACSFPTNIVGKLSHYHEKQYFDQKENDKIVKL